MTNTETHDTGQYTSKTLEQLREGQKRFQDRNQATITEISKEYSARLASENEPDNPEKILARALNMIDRPQKVLLQVMGYETARQIIWKVGNAILAQSGNAWQVDEQQASIIESLIRYFINDPSGRFELSKGICLFGDVGRGKTFLFKVIQVFCNASKIENRQFKFANCADISDRVLWAKENMAEVIAGYCDGAWFFDDLGNEPSAVKSYGNEIQVMERILMQRYPKFVNGFCITHVTTNDTPDELETKYGTRLADRAKEMFNFVKLPGESKRK